MDKVHKQIKDTANTAQIPPHIQTRYYIMFQESKQSTPCTPHKTINVSRACEAAGGHKVWTWLPCTGVVDTNLNLKSRQLLDRSRSRWAAIQFSL